MRGNFKNLKGEITLKKNQEAGRTLQKNKNK